MNDKDSLEQANFPIFIFDNPRTCSHLLHMFFAAHPQLAAFHPHFYQWCTHAAIAGPARLQLSLKQSSKAVQADKIMWSKQKEYFEKHASHIDIDKETAEIAGRRLNRSVQEIQNQGKHPFIKEHMVCQIKQPLVLELLRNGSVNQLPSNPTVMPDELFYAIKRPIVLVHHPALVIPSFWRAQQTNFMNEIDDEAIVLWTMQRTARLCFDSLIAAGADPIVVDGADVVHKSQALCLKLCQLWGIDADGTQFSWTAPMDKSEHPLNDFQRTFQSSSSVVRSIDEKVDIDKEQVKWKVEFGSEMAEKLRSKVDADMNDYNYMQQFRLKV